MKFKLIFYVPENACERVKEAIFETGAGSIGNYSHCSFQVKGQGQFRPLESSNPSIGQINKIEKVSEYRVEILCLKEQLDDAISALKGSHPYEEVAYEVVSIENY